MFATTDSMMPRLITSINIKVDTKTFPVPGNEG